MSALRSHNQSRFNTLPEPAMNRSATQPPSALLVNWSISTELVLADRFTRIAIVDTCLSSL